MLNPQFSFMPIYTKTGDNGSTSLANMERVSKASPRLQAYGTADELNAWVGLLRAQCTKIQASQHGSSLEKDIDTMLYSIQNRLFNAGAILSLAQGEWFKKDDVLQLEQWIDAMQAQLLPLRCFILPAGNETICTAHLCRTVTRRLERLIVELIDTKTATTQEDALLQFINRLSDYFFTLARYLAFLSEESDVPWKAES